MQDAEAIEQEQASVQERRNRAGFALQLLLVAACFAVLAWFGITLTRDAGRIAALWLPNAFLVAMILRRDWREAAPFLATCLASNTGVGLFVGDALFQAAGLALSNMLEVSIVYFGVRNATGSAPDLKDIRTLGWFAIFGGVLAPAASATLATIVLSLSGPTAFVDTWVTWATSDGLGMLIAAPLIMVLASALREGRFPRGQRLAEWIGLAAAGGLGTAMVFTQSEYPLLFLASMFVLLAAFRLGMTGAAAATTMVATAATIATTFGLGPIHLIEGSLHDKVLVLQLFLICTFACAVPVASALATRERLQSHLKESHDFAQSILDNMREIIFRTDAKGCWTFLNPAWEQLTGYSVSESLGIPTTTYLVRADYEKTLEQYPPLVSGEVDELTLNQRFRRADGEVRHVEVSVRAIRGPGGEFLGTSGNIRDVTDARQAEEALAKSEKLFYTLAEFSPAGIFRTSPNGACTYVNDAWLNLAGLTHEEAMGSGWAKALHPEDREDTERVWTESVVDGREFRTQFRFLRPDGQASWVMVRAAPELGHDGSSQGFVGVVYNITELVEAREELERERSRYKRLADNTSDAIVAMDLEGVCTYASPAIEEISGYKPEEVMGRGVEIPIEGDGLAEIQATYARMFAGEIDRAILTYRVKHRRDGWRWHESSVQLVRNPRTGEPDQTIASVRDVTERIKLEDQLRRARDAAETAARAKANFLANMSHEIRTPMNGVLGFADLLLDSRLNAGQRKYVELIAESGRSMIALIDDILDLSKIDAGQMAVVSDPIDLRETLDGTLQLMRVAAQQKGLALEVSIDEKIGERILGDKLRLRQIVSNLVGNAIKFTEAGHVRLDASLDVAGENEVLAIAVSDTGIGIDTDRLAAIFDEFAQADNSTSRIYGGTGLGLAISRSLADLMNGSLSVASEPGEGSTFLLRIPYLPCAPGAQAPFDQAGSASAGVKTAARRRRILIVEDHEINQLLITSLVEKAGHDFEVAEDGLQAIEKIERAAARSEPFDLVLMDIQMPRLDGLEATRRIRAAGHSATALPIVAVTANAYRSDIEECLAVGMQAHLAKPVRMDQFARVLDIWLPETGRAEGPAAGSDSTVEALRPRYDAFKREIREQLERCEAALPDADGEQLAELMRLMHKLAGSAAMFGEEELGKFATELGRRYKSADTPPDPASYEQAISQARAMI